MTPAGVAQLKEDEGLRLLVYDDATGSYIRKGPGGGYPTIGYGRNLIGQGITTAEAALLLQNDLAGIRGYLVEKLPWFSEIPPIWQDVVIMLEYNTGEALTFTHMLAAMKAGNAELAVAQLMESAAARELPARYNRMRNAILADHW